MSNQPIDKNFISPIDHFLFGFDKTHTPSESQLKEIEKHARIAMLRDTKIQSEESIITLENF